MKNNNQYKLHIKKKLVWGANRFEEKKSQTKENLKNLQLHYIPKNNSNSMHA